MRKTYNYGSQKLYYAKFYNEVVGAKKSGIIGYLASYPHKLLEKSFSSNAGKKILEVGAGQAEHVQYVVSDYELYFITDLNLERLNEAKIKQNEQIKIKKINAQKIKFNNNEFDRLISTCLLAHLRNPEKALLEWRRVVKHGGIISIYISTDPSFALKLFRNLSTKRKAKKLGFEGYELFIAREHLNSAPYIIQICKYVFREDKLKIYYKPFGVRSWYLNLVCIIQITINKNTNQPRRRKP